LVTEPVQPISTSVVPATAPATVQAAAQLSGDVALIYIYRVRRMAGAAIGYDIHWGDETIWRAKNNSKATIRLSEAGIAALWAKTESRVDLPLDIQLGHEYYVRCGMKMGAFVGRPELELVDAATGKAEFDAIASTVPDIVIPVSAPTEPIVTPAPPIAPQPVAPIEVFEEVVSSTPPESVAESEPEPLPEGIGNGTLEMLQVAMPDSIVFRPAAGVEIPPTKFEVSFASGRRHLKVHLRVSARAVQFRTTDPSKIFEPGNAIYTDQTRINVSVVDAPAGFRPDRIVLTVAGREMVWDIERAMWIDN
jgi:hypothetical protein